MKTFGLYRADMRKHTMINVTAYFLNSAIYDIVRIKLHQCSCKIGKTVIHFPSYRQILSEICPG